MPPEDTAIPPPHPPPSLPSGFSRWFQDRCLFSCSFYLPDGFRTPENDLVSCLVWSGPGRRKMVSFSFSWMDGTFPPPPLPPGKNDAYLEVRLSLRAVFPFPFPSLPFLPPSLLCFLPLLSTFFPCLLIGSRESRDKPIVYQAAI